MQNIEKKRKQTERIKLEKSQVENDRIDSHLGNMQKYHALENSRTPYFTQWKIHIQMKPKNHIQENATKAHLKNFKMEVPTLQSVKKSISKISNIK